MRREPDLLGDASRPLRHHDDARGQVGALENGMGDKDHAQRVFLPQFEQIVVERLPRQLVERRERLVHQEKLGLCGNGARDGHAHLHAAGELAWKGFLEAIEPDALQGPCCAVCRLASIHALQIERQARIHQRRAPRHQCRFLEDETDLGFRLNELNRACGWLKQSGHDAQRRGLAAARRPKQRHELAFRHRKVDAVERQRAVVERLADALERDERSHVPFPRAGATRSSASCCG